MNKPTLIQLKYTFLITELYKHIQDLDLINKIVDHSEKEAIKEHDAITTLNEVKE